MLMGHAGYHDAANANPATGVRITNDLEYQHSDGFAAAAGMFRYLPVPVTAVNCTWHGERLRWRCLSLPGPAKMEGNCHLVFRPDVPGWALCARGGVGSQLGLAVRAGSQEPRVGARVLPSGHRVRAHREVTPD